ncbi:MAG: Jag N-terminal domain-containing protein, partial [Candidatus Limnocylindria bacterium]
MTFREFTGKNVEEAIRTAMKEFGADLSDLDIEILAQGSRGVLGVGAEEARILAAPKSAVEAAESVRVESAPVTAEEPQAAPDAVAAAEATEPSAEEPAPVDLAAAAADADA